MDQNWVATILWSAMIQVLYRDVQFVFHLFKPKENGVVYVQAVIADCLLVELAREDTLFCVHSQPSLFFLYIVLRYLGTQDVRILIGRARLWYIPETQKDTYHAGRPIAMSSRSGKAIGRPKGTASNVSLDPFGPNPRSKSIVAYLAAGREVLALGGDALVVVDVVLPAVLGLVLVREAGVEAWTVSWTLSGASLTAPGNM